MSFNIEEELKKIPEEPGVYIMRDDSDEIIYVGKAVNLHSRVRQYFRGRDSRPKIKKMVPRIARFEYIITDSELEALILECNLIKEYRPKYNTLLTDDKSYPYIAVTVREEFPRLFMTRKVKRDRSKYFGPYSGVSSVKEIVELLRKLYNIRTCNKRLQGDLHTERPCLYYHIHQCKAPCQGFVSREEYAEGVRGAIDFLNGNYKTILDDLTAKMQEASDNMSFEEAIRYRDLIADVRHIGENQKAAMGSTDDRDIIAVAFKDTEAIAQIFFVRNGRLIGREHYHLQVEPGETGGEMTAEFIKQFYSGTPFIPGQLMLSYEIADREVLEEWLTLKREAKVRILVPQKGKKEKLVSLAKKNAQLVLDRDIERMKREEASTRGAASELGALLGIPFPKRIESYDISNINGFLSVGSMVVYENGMPKKADYRKFRIKTVSGPDDYGSMEEILNRRFNRALKNDSGFNEMPDLILMDGGKGQVHSCLKVLEKLKLNIPVAGMVKDDRHRTRCLLYNDNEVYIEKNSGCFRLLTGIQDEVHRFAITYHRLLRSKGQVHSVLDDIPQIGPARKKAIMGAYDSIEQLKGAGEEELSLLPGMNRTAAKAVFDFFHKEV